MTKFILKSFKQVKRIVIVVIGFTILLIGIVMIVLPGPAFIVMPIGLGILATEFIWARRVLEKVKDKVNNIKDKLNNKGVNNCDREKNEKEFDCSDKINMKEEKL